MKHRTFSLLVAMASLLATTPGTALADTFSPPTLTMEFGTAYLSVGSSTSLVFHVGNPNTGYKLIDVAFIDDLPAGLAISGPPIPLGTCHTYPGASVTAPIGGHTIKVSGLAFDGSQPDTCYIGIYVAGVSPGLQKNKTGEITGYVTGPLTGTTASANITVVGPPVTSAVFAPNAINAGGTTNGTITITNAAGNTVGLTGVGFNATMPAGLTVRSEVVPWCAGTLTLTAPNRVSLSGASVGTGSPCVIPMGFSGLAAGSYPLTTGPVWSINGGPGSPGTATLTVRAVAASTASSSAPTSPSASSSESAAPSESASSEAPSESASVAPSESASVAPSASASGATGGSSTAGDGGSTGLILAVIAVIGAVAVMLGLVLIARRRR